MAASVEIISIGSIGTTSLTLEYKASGLAMDTEVYRIYVYAILDGEEEYVGRTTAFAGPSYSGEYDVDGLMSSTTYKFRIKLYNTSGEDLGVSHTTVNSYRTDDADPVAQIYYAGITLNGNGGKSGTKTTIEFYDPDENWMSSWDDSATIWVDFDGSSFTRTGYTLIGFSKTSDDTTPNFDIIDSLGVNATSTDPDDPTMRILYAIWIKTIEPWEWWSTIGGEVEAVKQSDGTYHAALLQAAEWLAFIDKIQEVADALGETLNSTYVEQAKTGVVKGYGMCDYQFNGARLLITQMGGSDVPALVYAGDNITASQIDGIKDSLNNLIPTS